MREALDVGIAAVHVRERRAREAELALCRSALYEAIAVGFRPPSPEAIMRLGTRRGAYGLVHAAARLDAAASALARMDGASPRLRARPALTPLVEHLAETDVSALWLARSHRRLFGHGRRGEVPVCETEYGIGDGRRQPQELAGVAGSYAALGVGIAAGAGESPDHVSGECEFMMVLTRRHAVALECNDAGALAATRRAYRPFLRDHLARFVPALAERLRQADGGGFYAALGALAEALVRAECARLGVTPGPATLGLRPPVDDSMPMLYERRPIEVSRGAVA